MGLIHLDKENFYDVMKKDLVVVDFFATWCGPCKMLSPIIEKVANDVGDASFIKVDVDKHEELARAYGIMSIPTVIFFRDGEEVRRHVGFISEEKIKSIIDEV